VQQAREEAEVALKIQEQLLAAAPNDPDTRYLVAISEFDVGAVALSEGRRLQAELYLGRARQAADDLTRDRPREAHFLCLRAHVLNNLGVLALQGNELTRAAELFEESSRAWTRLHRTDPASVEYTAGLGRSLANLGVAWQTQGYLKRAEARFREALAHRDRLVREHPGVAVLVADLSAIHTRLGRVALDRNQFDSAAEEFQQAFQALEQGGAEDGALRQARCDVYSARGELASRRARYSDAEQDLAKAVEFADAPRKPELRVLHGVLLALSGKPDGAIAEVDAALNETDLPPTVRFEAARALAIAARNDANRERAEARAAHAVRLLTELVPTGYFTPVERRELLDAHPDLTGLRLRADFKAFRDKIK
jgi:tetratricopeptide (TPR) repeat protein